MAMRQVEEEEGVTAADLAKEVGIDYPSVLQVMRRLRSWGYVRIVGFNPPKGGLGRQRHVFEVTDKGMKKAEWESGKRRKKR